MLPFMVEGNGACLAGSSQSRMSVQGVFTMSICSGKESAKASMSAYIVGSIQSSGSTMEIQSPLAMRRPMLQPWP